MNKMDPPIPVLDEYNAGFIQKYVSINIAARDDRNVPSVTRAYGCRVVPDRSQVMVYICETGNSRLITNLTSNGVIAAVFSRPTTHETLQLKTSDAHMVYPLAEVDYQIINEYRQFMVEELALIGYPASFVNALVPGAEVISHGVLFTPQHAFVQTPGPNAGRKLS